MEIFTHKQALTIMAQALGAAIKLDNDLMEIESILLSRVEDSDDVIVTARLIRDKDGQRFDDEYRWTPSNPEWLKWESLRDVK